MCSKPAEHVTKANGPLASVYRCGICNNFEVRVPRGLRNAGRGYGLAAGNSARGEVIRHIKAEHCDKEARS